MPIRTLTAAVLISGLTGALLVAPPAGALQPLKGAPQTTSGVGDAVPSIRPVDEPIIVTTSHDGESNFIVKPIGKDGEEGFSWVNEIGPYSGTTFQTMDGFLASFDKKNPIIAADVMADGNWSIQIRKLKAAPKKGMKRGSGTGDVVFRFPKATKGLTRMTLVHDGESNFIVKPISTKGDDGFSLVNEIGRYKGTVRVPAGTKYIWVQADGNWNYTTK